MEMRLTDNPEAEGHIVNSCTGLPSELYSNQKMLLGIDGSCRYNYCNHNNCSKIGKCSTNVASYGNLLIFFFFFPPALMALPSSHTSL